MAKYLICLFLITQFTYCKQTKNKVDDKPIILINSKNANGHNTEDTVQGYFNDDEIKDYIEINSSSVDEKVLKIFLGDDTGKFKEVKSFSITPEDFNEVDNPIENSFISKGKTGEIILGASCCANFKTTEIYYYKFLKENWFLYKTSISEVDDDFTPQINIVFNDLSRTIDGKSVNNKDVYEKEVNSLKNANISMFKKYFIDFKSANQVKSLQSLNSIGFDEIVEMLYFNPITETNVNDYNDIAYYNSFTKEGNITSILLLKAIVEKYPNRIVAYLNLADCYWEVDNKKMAKDNYQKYLELMKAQYKDLSKIPQRAYDRSK